MACNACVEQKMLDIWALYKKNKLYYATLRLDRVKKELSEVMIKSVNYSITKNNHKAKEIMNEKCDECPKEEVKSE